MDFRKFDGIIGGVERGVIEISTFLAKQGHIIVLLPKISRLSEVKELFGNISNIQYIPLQVQSHGMSLRNVFLDSFTIQKIARNESGDVIHFPYNWSFPFRKSTPTILTVHDVIPLSFREAMGLFTNLFLYRPGMRLATRLNDIIITVSEFSKEDICNKLGVPREKVRVINNGLRDPHEPSKYIEAILNAKYELGNGFILYVGGIHERKNVVGLIRAYAKFVNETSFSGKLLITGNVSGAPYQVKMKKVHEDALDETGIGGQVEFTGFIPDEHLDYLMKHALFLVYPSLYEGFGIPVLEAMQVGTPVITSNVTALPEVAGGAALLINPRNIEDISEAMIRLFRDKSLRRELVEGGIQRAKEYKWEKTAKQYFGLYTEILDKSIAT